MSIAPRRLGKYELQERLGRGGMAEVWKALDTQLHRFVAIKLLQANLQADPNFVQRFTHEARIIASLRHPNIVQIHDFYSAEGSRAGGSESDAIAYMVMEYIPGSTLADYIRSTSRQGEIPPAADIIRLFAPISLAIDYAHQQGMIHRDIKPANILLDSRNTSRNPMGEPILSDFGLAKVLDVASQTLTGSIMGTPLYISPEQVQNRPVSPQTDLYALGIMLYEIFTGRPPFRGESVTAIMMQHITTTPEEPHRINTNLPPALSKVLLKSMAKKPQDRYPSAVAMITDVAAAFKMALPEDLKRVAARSGDKSMADLDTVISKPSAGKTPLPPSDEVISTKRDDADTVLPVSPYAATLPANHYAPDIAQEAKAARLDRPEIASEPARNQYAQVDSDADMAQNNSPFAGKQVVASRQATPVPPSLEPAPIKSPSPPASQRRRGMRLGLIILLVFVVAGSGVGAFFLFNRPNSTNSTAGNTIVGQAFFMSSGKINETTNEGSNDEFQINLHNIPPPQAGTSYYAWLLPDKNQSEEAPILLGKLQVKSGSVNFFYGGDPNHTNLLAVTSQLLITEESANVTPLVYSPLQSKWRYIAEIPQTVAAGQTYSLLDHLRHLLASDPEINPLHLPGGLDIWAYRNTQKVMQFATDAQKDWNAHNFTAAHQQIVGILDYLDGTKFVSQDVPAGTPITANATFAQIGLLQLQAGQNPSGYLYHILLHLNGVLSSPGATQSQHTLAGKIDTSTTNVQHWLEKVRSDAMQLAQMDNAHLALQSSLPLLNDMVTQATYAFMGHNDASTGLQEGFSQIYVDIQHMATFEVSAYKQ